MKPLTLFSILLPALVLLAAVHEPIQAQTVNQMTHRTVTVAGEGTVDVQPDMAVVRFSIVSRDKDPETARANNATASRETMNAVRELGVPERKIRLEQLQLQPAREYNPETRRYDEVGFEVTRTLVVELEELDRLPALIAQVIQKGANRLSQVYYDVQDREGVKEDALRLALVNARRKARLMAETLDAALGAPLQISEQGVSIPRPMVVEMAKDARLMAADAQPEPEAYAAGEIQVKATVNVTFLLED